MLHAGLGCFLEHEKSVKVHARNRAGTKWLTSMGLRPKRVCQKLER
jgi:hypothetical protein